ncbi:glycosyltransferase family 2 protein [Enterococcus sp. HY326]|uniref:glycosyltransferase n=1 Tax=Enterococcus sp. HY326 TaxID=2971265 RepID=UPI00223F69CC|nr:glycosyltransferase family 2 protein [Enterococcus sp. HY326]
MKKKNKVYICIILFWVALLLASIPDLTRDIWPMYSSGHYLISYLLTIDVFFISYFWLNGMKDIVYVAYFHAFKNKWLEEEKKILSASYPMRKNPVIALVYTTKDDFDAASLDLCSKQTYRGCRVYILDDSKESEYIQEIDNYSRKKKNVTVVRRGESKGFKAGNLNSFLNAHIELFDYFVVLDSDEIIHSNFVEDALKYFYSNENLGILQANHVATRNKNKFMEIFHVGVNCHWPTYQKVKEKYGFLSFLGHGAMISAECYKKVGGFPELVAEDLCFSILARKMGFDIEFSRLITCEEEFPIDYRAFKIRHHKWTLGNFELLRKFTKEIFWNKNLRWFEKLDVFLFTYNLPLTFVFFIFLVINILWLPLLGHPAQYPLWLMIPTIIFLFSPMFNDIVIMFKTYKILGTLQYCSRMFLLYGSLYWISFYAATCSVLGQKAYFYVTPKEVRKTNLLQKIRNNWQEILFGSLLMIITVLVNQSFLPSILIVVPSLSGITLERLSEKDYSDKASSNPSTTT